MKQYFKPTLLILIAITMFSCRSSKDLVYLRDSKNNEMSYGSGKEYVLKPGDILFVNIKTSDAEVNAIYNPEGGVQGSGYGDYNKYTTPSGAYLYGYEIDPQGFINLPGLGKLKISGINLSEVQALVQKKADEYLNDAMVKVKLLNFKITITGEVKSSGVYYNYDNSINVLEAIALANGNTDYASIKKIMVIRQVPEGKKTYILDLSSKKAYLSEAFYLQPDDYIIVQPDKYKNYALNSQAYSMILSSVSMMLAVLGFVLR